MKPHLAAAFCAVWLTTGLAWSQPLPKFGDAGQIAVATDLDISIGHTTHVGDFDVPRTTIAVWPAGDVFVARNISVGGLIYFQYVDTQTPVFGFSRAYYVDTTIVLYGTALRLGVNLPFGDFVSLWPRASIGVWKSKTSWEVQESLDPNQEPNRGHTENAVWLGLYAPILIHPVRHFFLGFGPDVFVDLSHKFDETIRKRTHLGASTVVGGWF